MKKSTASNRRKRGSRAAAESRPVKEKAVGKARATKEVTKADTNAITSAPPEVKKEAAPQTTLEWGKTFLPEHFTKSASKMHEWLAEQLDAMRDDRGARINLIGPRGSAKSTVATLCHVLHAAVEGWEKYIWIVSDTSEQAKIHLDNLRIELCDNEKLIKQYGESIGRGRHWRSAAIELSNEVTIESLGTGQGLRGRRRRALRPTLIVCDDLQNDSHISSGAQREASRRWFHGTLLNAGTPTTNVVNLATALHRDALAMELARAAGWTSRNFKSIRSGPWSEELWKQWEEIYCDVDNPNARLASRAFYEAREAEMKAGADVLWEDVENLYTLMRLRADIGHTAFDREKQGIPVNPEMCEWPEEYFGEHIWFDAWPEGWEVRALALDPSKGRDAGRGDYSAYVFVGVDRREVIHVEADLARRPTPQMVSDGVALWRRFRPHIFGIEANQYQELLGGEFRLAFERAGLGHVSPALVYNYTNKIVRIRTLGPLLAQRRLRFLRGSPSTRLLVDQLRDFPAGAHDDGPDALDMAWRLAKDYREKRRQVDDGLGSRLIGRVE